MSNDPQGSKTAKNGFCSRTTVTNGTIKKSTLGLPSPSFDCVRGKFHVSKISLFNLGTMGALPLTCQAGTLQAAAPKVAGNFFFPRISSKNLLSISDGIRCSAMNFFAKKNHFSAAKRINRAKKSFFRTLQIFPKF